MSEKTTQETIGKILDAGQQRDAIHIAVYPVTADEILYPGQKVQFVAGKECRVKEWKSDSSAVGIVDPFYDGRIYPDQRCWLFLFPNTVTGMRHEWQHPAFVEFREGASASWEWMRELAKSEMTGWGEDRRYFTAEELIQIGKDYLSGEGTFCQQGSDSLSTELDSRSYWAHFQAITGIIVPSCELDMRPFSCSC